MSDLLLEIGTEEIPASYVSMALEFLKDRFSRGLDELKLAHGIVTAMGTPRRLAVLVDDVADLQPDREEYMLGPPEKVAFDETGAPTKAATGFAKGQGVNVDDLTIIETPRGRYTCVKKKHLGRPAKELLASEIPVWIKEIPFPKSMRWGEGLIRFARPIRWILALLGDETLEFSMDGLKSGRTTRGHRFMAPQEREVAHPKEYVRVCRELHVVVDPKERAEIIQREAREAARAVGGRLVEDEELLWTVVNLVEEPVVIIGGFSREYLELPKEVLITVMREQQKFFAIEDQDGGILPHFVSVSNLRPADTQAMKEGNERVLRARLSDARFFFKEDRKKRLEQRLERLSGVIFHAKLGSMRDKVERLVRLCGLLASQMEPDCVELAQRAALLCKCDLATEMVGEFPTLQGIMGRHYAMIDGEDPKVADAIRDHYLPAFSGDRVPDGPVGAMVALADKLDTVVGCFAVGEVPTGAGDPLGVRRAALGILRILLERGYRVDVGVLVRQTIEVLESFLGGLREGLYDEVMEFLRVRLQNLWASRGHNPGAIEAILATGLGDLLDAKLRLEALERFMDTDGFDELAVGFKRVINIVGGHRSGDVDPSVFMYPEERDLWDLVQWAESDVDRKLCDGDPLGALMDIAQQKPRVDRFFDAVLVNDPDEKLRTNRLNLLARLARVFLRLADFSKLAGRV